MKSTTAYFIMFIIVFSIGCITPFPSILGLSTQTSYYTDYFSSYGWNVNPANMVDGNINTYSIAVSSGDVEYCMNHTLSSWSNKVCTKVEIRAYFRLFGGVGGADWYTLRLTPVKRNSTIGQNYDIDVKSGYTLGAYTPWQDITNDANLGVDIWTYVYLETIDCNVTFLKSGLAQGWCSRVEIRVTLNDNPVATSFYPKNIDWELYYNCSVLNYSSQNLILYLECQINDTEGDNMNISFYFESTFLYKYSEVGNGTYRVYLYEYYDDEIPIEDNLYWQVRVNDSNHGSNVTYNNYFDLEAYNQCPCPDDSFSGTYYYNYTDDNLTVNFSHVYHWNDTNNTYWVSNENLDYDINYTDQSFNGIFWFNITNSDLTINTSHAYHWNDTNNTFWYKSSLDDYEIYCTDDSFSGTFWFNYSNVDLSINTSHVYHWNDTNNTFWYKSTLVDYSTSCPDDSFNGIFYFNWSNATMSYNTSHAYHWNDTNNTFWYKSNHLNASCNASVIEETIPFIAMGIVFTGSIFYCRRKRKNNMEKF